MPDPFDRYLEEEDAMDHDDADHDCTCDLNAPHGSNTEEEMTVDADDEPAP